MWECGGYRGFDRAFTLFVTTLVVLSMIAGPVGASLPSGGPTESTLPASESIDGATGTQGVGASIARTDWSALDADDWSTVGRDPGRSGHNPDSSGPKTDPDARWIYEFADDEATIPVVTADGTVFVPGDQSLRAVDADTGEVFWNVSGLDLDSVSVADGVVFTTEVYYSDSEIRAYDATDGSELWNVTGFTAESSVVLDGTVYASRAEGHVHAFDLHTGDERWSARTYEELSVGLSAAGDTIYAAETAASRDRAVFALNASDGSERWRFEMEGEISMAPVVANGSVFVGAGSAPRDFTDEIYDPKFYRLNATDGHVEWIFDVNTRPNGAAVADGSVYVAAGNTIHALDGDTGQREWVHRLTADMTHGLWYGNTVALSPAVADGTVYAANHRGHLVALDGASGDDLWRYELDGVATSPAVADDRVYVLAVDTTDSNTDYTRVYALEDAPFAFSGFAPPQAVEPGEAFSVDVTVENVDDETRTYNLSLVADEPFPSDPRVLGRENGTLQSGETTTLTFTTALHSAALWNLSVQRLLDRGPVIGPGTVDVVHPNPDDRWSMGGFDADRADGNPATDGPSQHLQERWNASYVDEDTTPAVVDGTAYVVTHQNRYYGPDDVHAVTAYDAETGVEEWAYNFTVENRVPSGSPAVVGDTVYVVTRPVQFDETGPSTEDGSVYAIDAATGGLAWKTPVSIDDGSTYDHGPVVADGLVYTAGAVNEEWDPYRNASVVALDADSGSPVWSDGMFERGTHESYGTYAAGEGHLFVTASDEDDEGAYEDELHAYDASGSFAWTTESLGLVVDHAETPVVADGLVFVVDESVYVDGEPQEALVALNVSTGAEEWRFVPSNIPNYNGGDDDGWTIEKPAAYDGSLYVRQRADADPSASRLHRLDLATGAPSWNVSTNYLWQVQVVDGIVYGAETEHSPGYTEFWDAKTGEHLGNTGMGLSLAVVNGTAYAYDDWSQRFRALTEGGVIEYTDFTVDSHTVEADGNATVTVTATNVGDLPRWFEVGLQVSPDDHHHVYDSVNRDGTLAPGESTTLTWDVLVRQRGDFVFTLSTNDGGDDFEYYEYDRAGSTTVNVGDDGDGSVVDLGDPRDLAPSADSWPTESFDAGNTGNYTGTGAPTAVGDDTVTWLVNQSTAWDSGPTVVDETIFVGGQDTEGSEALLAVDATDGSVRWEYPTSSGDFEVQPTYASGYVYSSDSNGRVYQFDASTGERLWSYRLGTDVGGITVVDDVAYVAGYGWDPSDYGAIHALNATTREVLWTFQTDTSYQGMSVHPAVENGVVYVTSDDGRTYALDAATGAVAWSRPIAGSNLHSPVVEDGVVYADNGTSLYALDATDGSTIWSTLANVDGDTGSSPALADDTLFFTADGAVQAVDATTGSTGGDQLWRTQLCAAADASPVYADGTVFVPMDDSTIRAYDATTGDLVWRYAADAGESFTPAVVDGLLYSTGLEIADGTDPLVALSGGTTDEPMAQFDYSGVTVSDETVATGESLTVSATVENLGSATCEYAADLRVDGTVVDTITGSVGPGSYNTETVEFAHTFDSTGTYDVTIEDLSPVSVNVTESSADPIVSPSTRDFGDVDVGNATDRWVQVTNDGTETLYLDGAAVSGGDSVDFSVLSVSQTNVNPGDTATIWARFAPTSSGPKSTTLEIETYFEGTVTASLTGTGVSASPAASVTPQSLDFGSLTTDTTATETVSVENVGGSTLTFEEAVLLSGDSVFDVVAGNVTTAIDPGESHDVTVEFAPTTATSESATLRLHTDDPGGPTVDVPISGNGVAPEPEVSVIPTSLDFGEVVTGTNESMNVTVENLGDASLAVDDVSITNEDLGFFAVDGDVTPFAVGPDESAEIPVTFAPTAFETDSATLSIETNDTDEATVNVALTGTGTEPPGEISVAPSSLEFGDLLVGENATRTVTISNDGDGTLTVYGASLNYGWTDFSVIGGDDGAELAPGETHAVDVLFEPPRNGTLNGELRIDSDDPTDGQVTVDLNGSAAYPPGLNYAFDAPASVPEGENVTVMVGVLNNQNVPATFNTTLTVDGAIYTHWNGTLQANGTAVETFNLSLSMGDHVLAFEDLDPIKVEVTSGDNGMDGDGTETNPYVITDVDELQLMADDPSAHYVLGTDIDASATATWNDDGDGPNGFDPVGYWDDQFTGSLDGAGYEISDLYIDRRDEFEVGLFGRTHDDARVEDVTLTDVDVTGKADVGGLVGYSEGTLTGVSVTGTVTAGEHNLQSYAGGLVGQNHGPIAGATADATVSGAGHRLGGVVGQNRGAISDVTVTASISAPGYNYIGGIAGENRYGAITGAAASGTVAGENDVGGLVGGMNGGTIGDSTADVSVTGNGSRIGGLVGNSYEGGFVEGSTASGTVSGNGHNIGGLVGTNLGDVSNVSASGDVVGGGDRVGGLVGNNDGNVTDAFATGDVTGADHTGGLIGYATYSTVTVATATGAVDGNERVGGLVGFVYQDTTIDNASATGDVSGELAVGGLVGYASSAGVVTNAHANGAVTGTDTVGGLVGNNRAAITNTYASGFVVGTTAGGLVGDVTGGSVVDSYWDLDATNQSSSAGSPDSAGRLTTELTGAVAGNGTVPGFDFDGNWTVTDDYPRLRAHAHDVAVELGDTELEADETTNATVALVLFDGSAVPVTEISDYLSTDPSVATVSASGLVTAIDDGESTIEATASDLVGGVTLEVDSSGGGGGLPPLPPRDGDDDDRESEEPSFVVSDDSLSATDVTVGEPVTVTATITNDGDAAGTFTGTLTADGSPVESVSLDLDPGQSDSVSITWAPSAAGDYALSLDGEPVGTLTVSDADADDETAPDDESDADDGSPAPNESDSIPGFSIVGALFAITFCVIVVARRRRPEE